MGNLIHYDFRIDAWKPETLPMARLAEYLAKLSVMFGHKEHVHFFKVRKGSAIPEIAVEYEAAPKVEARLRLVETLHAPPELKQANQDVNRMLRTDNASATLKIKHGANILLFPGKKTPLAEEVIVHEQGSLEGVVIRIGGKDESVPIWIEGEGKIIYKCWANRDLARQLAAYYLGSSVRATGSGKWCRTPERKWEIEDFQIKSFEIVEDSSLEKVIESLRQVEGNLWNEMDDPQAELRKLRGN